MAETELTRVRHPTLASLAEEARSIGRAVMGQPKKKIMIRLATLADDIDRFDELYRMRDALKGRS